MEKIQACYSSIHPPLFLLWNLQGIKCHMWKLNIHFLAELQVNVWYDKLSRNRKTNVLRILWHCIYYESCYHYSCPRISLSLLLLSEQFDFLFSELILWSASSLCLFNSYYWLLLSMFHSYAEWIFIKKKKIKKKHCICNRAGKYSNINKMFYLPFKINHLFTLFFFFFFFTLSWRFWWIVCFLFLL